MAISDLDILREVACSAAEGDRLDTNGDVVAVSEQLCCPLLSPFDSIAAGPTAPLWSPATEPGACWGGSIPHSQFNSFNLCSAFSNTATGRSARF
jgi:hypothetical protein